MVKLIVRAEFRKFDEEKRTFKKMNDSGSVVGVEEYLSRVLRIEVDGEGCVSRLYGDVPVPADLSKGDMCDLEVVGMEVEKDVTYFKVRSITKCTKGAKA